MFGLLLHSMAFLQGWSFPSSFHSIYIIHIFHPFLCPWGLSYIRVPLSLDTLFPLVACSHFLGFPPMSVAMPLWGPLSPLGVEPNCSTLSQSHFTSPCVVTPFFSRSSRIDLLEQNLFCILLGPCNQWRCKASSAMYVLKSNSKMSEYNVHKKYHWVD